MVNQQLLDYVMHQLKVGVSSDVVRTTLLQNGWADADVDEAMQQATPKRATAPAASQAVSTSGAFSSASRGATMTRDIFQPSNEPVFQPSKAALDRGRAGTKEPAAAVAAVAAGGVAAPAKRGIALYIVMAVLALVAVGAGGYAFTLSSKSGALAKDKQLLTQERDALQNQVQTLTQQKNDEEQRARTFQEQSDSLGKLLAVFKNLGVSTSTPQTLTIRGTIHGDEKSGYTLTHPEEVVFVIANSKDAKIQELLKPLVGTLVDLTASFVPHAAPALTVSSVNGAPAASAPEPEE